MAFWRERIIAPSVIGMATLSAWAGGAVAQDLPPDKPDQGHEETRKVDVFTNQARARSLRTLRSSTGRSGMVIRKVAPMVPSTR